MSLTSQLPTSRREICTRCLRPVSACICQWITATSSKVELIILQHPLEQHHAKGSARLLHLSVANSQLHIAEKFETEFLQSILFATEKTTLLLYPKRSEGQSGVVESPPLDHQCLALPDQLRLIVLDGTWRKSRKMLYQNPLLQSLARLALNDMPDSQYRIRKAHRPDQLSTLEATCQALMLLENNSEKYQPLLAAFDGFIRQQQSLYVIPG
ncbi:tRNA-uridine aminocarboxypropyltransferase [Undibacterium parvum]|uniref:tRNA-uridine aminocarboxypropyltransferase n=1 Tax=Undibacterium parvum TaxID=401471 RepID=A0A3Q9BP73_9BURK|nr:tRNA-uridine aminocarboxypropyltransferase [Undibacterium parvum]AZP11358.1 DTW domain-containing protein [Undibacterium parvum]